MGFWLESDGGAVPQFRAAVVDLATGAQIGVPRAGSFATVGGVAFPDAVVLVDRTGYLLRVHSDGSSDDSAAPIPLLASSDRVVAVCRGAPVLVVRGIGETGGVHDYLTRLSSDGGALVGVAAELPIDGADGIPQVDDCVADQLGIWVVSGRALGGRPFVTRWSTSLDFEGSASLAVTAPTPAPALVRLGEEVLALTTSVLDADAELTAWAVERETPEIVGITRIPTGPAGMSFVGSVPHESETLLFWNATPWGRRTLYAGRLERGGTVSHVAAVADMDCMEGRPLRRGAEIVIPTHCGASLLLTTVCSVAP